MGCFGSTTNSKSSGNQFNQGTSLGTSAGSFSNPLLNQFQNNLMGQINQGMNQANQPLYGQAQIGQYLGGLNNLANSSIQSLQGNLARSGGLNSGKSQYGQTQIGLGRMGQAANFLSQVPLWNREAQLQGAQTYGGLGNQLMSVAPRTNVSNQFTQGTGTNQNQSSVTQNPSIMSDIGQSLGIAGSLMGMPFMSGLGGGGGMGEGNGNFANLMNPYGGMSGAGSPFGAQVGGGLGQGAPAWLPNPFSLPGYQGGQ